MSKLTEYRQRLGMWMLGYDAAESSPRRKNLPATRRKGRQEDSLLGPRDREALRQEILNLRRNDPIVHAIARTFTDNVVGAGITPQAKTDSDEWNDAAESYFREWSKVCDLRQRIDFREMQRLVVTSRLFCGDVAFLLTAGGQLQPVEGERIRTPEKLKNDPNIVDGVRLSPTTGIPVAYYVFARQNDGTIDPSKSNYDEVQASDVFYVAAPFRFDQVRGIPELASCCTAIKDLDDLVGSTLEKARLDAKNAYAVITEDGVGGPGNLGSRLSSNSNSDGTQFERFDGAGVYYLRKGEDVKSLASQTPNSQYDIFTMGHLRRIGAAIGMPYEFIMQDFSRTNFSNARSALLQAYNTIADWQSWITCKFNQRVWNWRIAKAIKAGELAPAPIINGVSQWYQVEWSFPSKQWVDPQSQLQSNLLGWQLGVETITQMNRANGRDVEDVFQEKAKEIIIAQEAADDANKTNTGLGLTWRDIISAQIPGQTQPTAKTQPSKEMPSGDEDMPMEGMEDETD